MMDNDLALPFQLLKTPKNGQLDGALETELIDIK